MIPPARVLRGAFVGATAAWALMLPLAAYVASVPHASSVAYVFAAAVYATGSLVCHQLPARSFFIWAVQMPVCARCTGIYAGAAIAAIISAYAGRRLRACEEIALSVASGFSRTPEVRLKAEPTRFLHSRFSGAHAVRGALLLSALPTLATLVYEWTSGQMPGHSIRAAAGIPLGAVVAAVVVAAADNQVD